MDRVRRLTASIILNVLGFWAFHTAVFVATALLFRFDESYLWLYVAISLFVDGILLAILLFIRQTFFLLETQAPLSRVNFANKLTLFRISSLPSLVILFIASRAYPVALVLVVYAVIAFVTDLLDGLVSRATHQATRVGQYLDSMSDYAVLLGVAIAFVGYGFISLWFFSLVVVRFMAQWVSMAILFIKRHGSVEPRTSFLGKASVAVTMVVFAANLLRLFSWFGPYGAALTVVEIVAAVILVVSLVEKMAMFADDIKKTGNGQA